MPQRKNIAIFKWILLMTFTRVTGSMVVQFDNLKEEQLLGNINALQDNNIGNNLKFRKNTNAKDYLNRKLVKKIIPHGYEIKNFEFDNRFKTLYKPLIRIHKRKPVADASSDVKNENRYDLMLVLDDKRYEGVELVKDDSLLEPFAIDNMDIKYFPSDRHNYYIIKKNGNYIDYDHPRSNRYKLVDNKGQSEGENTQHGKAYDAYGNLNPNNLKFFGLLKQLLGKQHDNVDNEDFEQTNFNKHKLFDQISQPSSNRNKIKGNNKKRTPGRPIRHNKAKKLQWLGTLGQLISKQFQISQGNSIELHEPDYIRSQEENPLYNAYEYIDSMKQLIREQNDIKTMQSKKESSDRKNPYQWFGTIGQLYSKHLLKKETNHANTRDNPQTFKDRYFNSIRDTHNFPKSVNNLVESQIVKERSDESNNSKNSNAKHINRKQDKQNERVREQIAEVFKSHNLFGSKYTDKLKRDQDIEGINTMTSDKFKLLKEITQSRANYLEDNVKENKLNENEHLRTKSGELDEPLKKIIWHEETTTKKSDAWLPNYPFWNYWTYDKQIYQDGCNGTLIQYGRLCIEPL